MKPIDLSEILIGHEGEWVTFNDDYTKILAHSKSLERTKEKAEAKGFENPIFFRVPDKFIAQI